jgi:hypothetical protein
MARAQFLMHDLREHPARLGFWFCRGWHEGDAPEKPLTSPVKTLKFGHEP